MYDRIIDEKARNGEESRTDPDQVRVQVEILGWKEINDFLPLQRSEAAHLAPNGGN